MSKRFDGASEKQPAEKVVAEQVLNGTSGSLARPGLTPVARMVTPPKLVPRI
ncbi:hypothetical protein D3C80_927960 [compost metagenome]